LTLSTLILAPAFPTKSCVVSRLFSIGILLAVGVTLRAMGTATLWLPSIPSTGVFPLSHRLQMIRINAAADSTQMVKVQPIWNFPLENSVCRSICPVRLPSATFLLGQESAVPTLIQASSPQPATGERLGRNEGHESIYQRYDLFRHCDLRSLCLGLREAGNFVAARFHFTLSSLFLPLNSASVFAKGEV
jgi:hypothetical protein